MQQGRWAWTGLSATWLMVTAGLDPGAPESRLQVPPLGEGHSPPPRGGAGRLWSQIARAHNPVSATLGDMLTSDHPTESRQDPVVPAVRLQKRSDALSVSQEGEGQEAPKSPRGVAGEGGWSPQAHPSHGLFTLRLPALHPPAPAPRGRGWCSACGCADP